MKINCFNSSGTEVAYLQLEIDCHSHTHFYQRKVSTLRPTLPTLPYRQNSGSPVANDSNFSHSPSPLGCWLASVTLDSARMFKIERTSAEPLRLAHRTPGVRSNTG